MNLKFKFNTRNLEKKIKKINKSLDDINNEALEKFRELTPIDSGNARRSTVLGESRGVKEIQGRYPYAQKLDSGWSKQRRTGMTRPFRTWWIRRIRTGIRK